jgi:hypothetical protein
MGGVGLAPGARVSGGGSGEMGGPVRRLDCHLLRTAVGRDRGERDHRHRTRSALRQARPGDRGRSALHPARQLCPRAAQPVRDDRRVLRRRHWRRDRRAPRRHLRLARTLKPERVGDALSHGHAGAEPRRGEPARRRHPRRAGAGDADAGRPRADARAACGRADPGSGPETRVPGRTGERDARADARTDRAHTGGRVSERSTGSPGGRQARDRRRQPDPHAASTPG